MTINTMSDFNTKTTEELNKILGEKRKALQTFRFNMSGSKTKNVKEGKGLRKEIAQIMTAINATKA